MIDNINERIQNIIEEMKWEMREERSYANLFLENLNKGECDYILENSKRLMREKIQYLGGLADALRYLGFKVEFDAESNKKYDNVIFFKDVKIQALCQRNPFLGGCGGERLV